MIIDVIKPGSVITIKLTSGEELIASLDNETSTHYEIQKVMVIAMGQQGPGLMPYLFTAPRDAKLKLNKSTVTVITSTDAEFAKQYVQSTTSISLI